MERDFLKLQIDRLLTEFQSPLKNLSELLSIEPSSRVVEITNQGMYLFDKSNGLRFELNIEDPRTAVSCLLVQGYYEPTETAVLTELARVSHNILDIGANVGYYSVKLAKAMPNESSLSAIEPLKSAFDQLVQNISLNNLSDRVTVHQIALSASEQMVNLHVPLISGSSASSMRELHPEELNRIESVHALKLSTFISEFMPNGVDLIKIDVEGAELLVLESGWGAISKFKPVIFAELLRKWSARFGYKPETLKKKIEDLGYSCFEILPKNKISLIQEIDELTISTNFLFIPDDKKSYLDSILKEFL
jgi:FkbM family methyltransferase